LYFDYDVCMRFCAPVLFIVSLFVSGCGVAHMIEASQNRELLTQLELGMSRNDVEGAMGEPYSIESSLRNNGDKILILRYRTEHSGSHVEENSTTPVAFVDNKLIGWGRSALQLLD
jgi:hypothetical protein